MNSENESLMRIEGICKTFAGNRVLQPIHLTVNPGEFHALIGENGAGKSTLINLLTGVYEPDEGAIVVHGKSYPKLTPAQAGRLGIQAVHQELSLNRHLTVTENLFLGNEMLHRGMFRDKSAMRKAARQLLDDTALGFINPDAYVSDLSLPEQQLLEFAKAVSKKPRMLILDEATSALNSEQVDLMFNKLAELKAGGLAVLFISHRLNELFRICDIMTVLKDGQHIVTEPITDFDQGRLVKLMTGRELRDLFPPQLPERLEGADEVIRLERVNTRHLSGISFTARRGEILGVGGLAGQGQQYVLECLFGIERIKSGTMHIQGEALTLRSPAAAMERAIAYIPAERKTDGLLLSHSIGFNMSLARLRALTNLTGTILARREKRDNAGMEKDLQIKMRGMHQPVGELSGGNQQKVVLGKWMLRDPDILLLNDPTRGIDVGTKKQIYELLRELTKRGVTIVVVSSDTLELVGLCDRVIVLYENKINSELSAEQLSEEALVHASVFSKEEV